MTKNSQATKLKELKIVNLESLQAKQKDKECKEISNSDLLFWYLDTRFTNSDFID